MSSPLSNGPADSATDGTSPVQRQTVQAANHPPTQTQPTVPTQQIPMLKMLVVLVGGVIAIWYFGSQGGYVSSGLYIGVGMLAVILVVGLLSRKRL